MRYLLYKSTNLLDNILLGNESDCIYLRITDKDLKSKIFNMLIFIARKRNYYFPWLLKLIPAFHKLRELSPRDTIIIFDINDLVFLKYLKRSVPASTHFHVFYWNPIEKMFGVHLYSSIKTLKKLGCTISTFDKKDADTYHLIYKNQFIRTLHLQAPELVYDYYYIGQSKGREALLEKITNNLKDEGLQGFCLIPKSHKDSISYQENIRNVLSSRCLIEILQNGQSGITLRALEALIYQKKLITTCKDIVNYDFYNPKNILIWNDNPSELKSFVLSEYQPANEQIIRKYSFTNWIQSFT